MSAPQLVTGIHQLAIPCQDVPRATAFYRDAVGLKFLFEMTGLAFFDSGGVRLMLTPANVDGVQPLVSVIYFATGDITAATDAVLAKGAELLAAPHVIAKLPGREVWLSHWKDCEGNTMSFMQEKPVQPAP
jgi:methylmalonyl-CoA/ethylmalonyl-CoA epimerase